MDSFQLKPAVPGSHEDDTFDNIFSGKTEIFSLTYEKFLMLAF